MVLEMLVLLSHQADKLRAQEQFYNWPTWSQIEQGH